MPYHDTAVNGSSSNKPGGGNVAGLPGSRTSRKLDTMLGLIGRWMIAAAVGGVLAAGCQIEDPAAKDVDRLLTTQCEQMNTCRCAGQEDASACEVRNDTWNGRIEYGRARGLIYDPACLSEIEARVQTHGCSDATTADGHLCTQFCAVFHGSIELGEDCEGHDAVTSNCAQGTTCLEGTCVHPCDALGGLPDGALCRDDNGNQFDDCAENLRCDFTSNRCSPLPKAGEACPSGDCVRDAWCNYQSGRCDALPGIGEACGDTNCDSQSWCDWEANVCRRRAVEGESCQQSQCADELRCDYQSNVCRRRAEEGESCEGVGCVEGLYCGVSGICQPPAAIGESCDGRPCGEGWCDWNLSGRCAPLPDGEGQPCPGGECGGRLWCDTANDPAGECRLRAPFGDPCTGHRQCETGFCPAGYCDELPQDGQACDTAGACGNGLVCDGDVCVTALGRGSAVCSFAGW